MHYEAIRNELQAYFNGKHAREKVVEFVQNVVGFRFVIDRIFGSQHNTRDQNAHEQRVAKPSMIADEMARFSKSIVMCEQEQRASFRYGFDFLRGCELDSCRIDRFGTT